MPWFLAAAQRSTSPESEGSCTGLDSNIVLLRVILWTAQTYGKLRLLRHCVITRRATAQDCHLEALRPELQATSTLLVLESYTDCTMQRSETPMILPVVDHLVFHHDPKSSAHEMTTIGVCLTNPAPCAS